MTQMLGTTDFCIIGLMLAVSATIGLYFRFTGGRQQTTEEFLMADKSMSIFPVAFSLMATYMSAISVLGLPAETYMYGTQWYVWIAGVPIGGLIAAYGFLPVFYAVDAATAYEYLEKRFGRLLRSIASFLFSLQMILYMSVVLYAPALALNAVTGFPMWASVVSLGAVCTFYCALGGLKAVLWTDMFQASLMYVSTLAVIIQGTINVGGSSNVVSLAEKGERFTFFDMSPSLRQRYTFWNSLASGFVFSIHTLGASQTQIQRMLSVGNLKKAQIALFISIPLIVVFNCFCLWDGIVIYANSHDCDPLLTTSLTSPDQLMPYYIVKMFGHIPGLAGLCIAGVFSAALSTVSSAMNSLTAVTMEDFIKPYLLCKRLSPAWTVFMAKIIAACYGILCLLLTFVVHNFRGVLEACNVFFGMVGGPMVGIFILGMMTETANEKGSLIGLLIGFVFSAWMGFGSYIYKVEVPALPQSVSGCSAEVNRTVFTTVAYDAEYATEASDEGATSAFPLYEVSFMWLNVFGAIIAIIFGYICSFIADRIRNKKQVHKPEVFSPFVRRWFQKSSSGNKSTKAEIGMQRQEMHKL